MARHAKLTDDQFVEKYNQAKSLRDLAQLCGASKSWCAKRMKLLGLKLFPSVHWRNQPKFASAYEPTQEAIAAECLKIQATWTAQNEDYHRVTKHRHVEFREVTPYF